MMSPGFGAPLRFFFKITLKRHDLAEELISTREPRRLPVVLSPEEVGRLLAAATNTKHRAILSLAYATGLRASEVVSLKLTDIDRDRMLIRVEQGKGKKDRYVILSIILLEILHEWWRVAARRAGCLPVSPGCFPAIAGSIRARASCIASFAWQRGVPASPSVSAFIRCGTALPPISWSKRPIFGSSRFYWDIRNSTRVFGYPVPPGQFIFDPRAAYDRAADRFVITGDAFAEAPDVQFFFIAVSETPDATGAFFVQRTGCSRLTISGAGSSPRRSR